MEGTLTQTSTFRQAARVGLLLTLTLCAVLASSPQPGIALGTCGPTEKPNGIGTCQLCSGLITSAKIASASLGVVFGIAGIQNANYTISNNVGTFNIAGTNLSNYNFKAPPPASISVPPVSGFITDVIVPVPYTAYPNLPSLTLSWDNWTGGDSGIVINAQLSGQIAIHISADPVVVNPTLTLNKLPITMTFSTNSSGDALIAPSQVVVSPLGPYGSVSGCGAFGWCNGLVTGAIENAVQGQLQTALASQFAAALNGQNNVSPFWPGFLQTVANQPALSVFTDPAGNPLPRVNQATPGGTTTYWHTVGGYSYAGGQMTADFASSAGLCFIDCTPKLQSQLCVINSCGTRDDGCGDTVTCPGTCGVNELCESNQCKVCVKLTCANAGATCGPIPDGCDGTITCNICGEGMRCDGGRCVGFGGPGGTFCEDCRKSGGICNVGPDGNDRCIHE
jgi:hypothetical protein